jgi:cytochrome oxidase assembly protein ShyY1
MRLRFRFRAVPFAATVALVALGIALGNWQTRRAQEKTALQARLEQRAAAPALVLGPAPQDPAAVEFRRIIVTGEFVLKWPIFLDNRPLDGRSGYILLMPFKIAGSNMHVLVARGWLPRDPSGQTRIPSFSTLAGPVTIEGIAVTRLPRVMQLGAPPRVWPGAIVQNLEVGEVAASGGMNMQPFLIEQTGPGVPGETLVRKWPAPATDVDRHRGYAFQWYALAAMAFVFFVITGFRSGAKHAG